MKIPRRQTRSICSS